MQPMNLRRPNANDATGTANRSRDVVPMSGICSRCVDGCKGSCEIWLSSFRGGREVLYPPGPFGEITAGADKDYPIDYSHLNIQGYARGAKGCRKASRPIPTPPSFRASIPGPNTGGRPECRCGCRSSPGGRSGRPRLHGRTGITSPSEPL
ncbi:hypothetical protein [Methanoculleus chikugoensis]|uniref:hypothetical protein n=1 Tax=Methanoculleus chikugoensis TaxID=118126 RepID=UPI001FB407BE|nr:hypothetical protein [Methanoculleus chikugoensis]